MTVGGRGFGVLVVGLVAVLAPALVAVLPVTAAHAVGDLVVWPDDKDINPKVTPYSITVNDPEAVANLVARWNISEQDYREVPLPHVGTVTLPFAETFVHNHVTSVTIYRCVGTTWSASSCVGLDAGPWTNVWVEAALNISTIYTVGTTPQTVQFTYEPPGLGTSTWRLLAADGSELLTGQTGLGPGGQFSLAVPPGTPAQQGTLELVSSVDGTVVGHLDGRLSHPVGLDGVPPPAPGISVSASVVYPWTDDYLDSVEVKTYAPGAWTTFLEAVDQGSGAVHLLHQTNDPSTATHRYGFYGESDSGQRLPAGTYRFRVTAVDGGGQSSTLSDPIDVRWDRLRMLTWRYTVPAAKTVMKKYVGPCATLRKPAEPGWRGSLGFYSRASCNPERASVHVIHGLNLPPSMNDKYGAFRVSLTGGPNKRQPDSYLVLGYYTNAKKWEFENRRVFRGRGVQTHKGDFASRQTKHYIHDDGNGPYVAWSTGLTSGSRYDVKSFTVQISYQALVPEGQNRPVAQPGCGVRENLPRCADLLPTVE